MNKDHSIGLTKTKANIFYSLNIFLLKRQFFSKIFDYLSELREIVFLTPVISDG